MKTNTRIIIYFKAIASMVLLIFSSILYAGKEPELRSYKLCSNLNIADTLLVYDQLFLTSSGSTTATSASTYHLYKTLNYITLEVDQTTVVDCEIPQFTLEVIVKVDRLDAYGAAIGSFFYDTLDIAYDKTLVEKYKEKHTKTYVGGFWYTAEIVSIISSDPLVLPFVKLSIGTQIERYKDINTSTIPTFLTSSYSTSNTEISVFWDEIEGSEEYDLEWVWYDDYANSDVLTTTISASDIEYSFKNNASRVTIKDNTYQITPAFERGYLLFRVRAVGYTGASFNHRVEGAWSSQNYGPKISNSSGTSFTNNKDVVYINDAASSSSIKIHEPKLNWQFSSVFAEEGKKKEIIAYFDGSLHNRQTVTKINTDHQSIVGETVYDYLGRPAVNILPAPSFENKLKFYAGFNLSNTTNLHYRRSDFDLDNGSCVNTVNSLSDASGAAHYYSPENPLAGDLHHEYIPNSNGYPFTLTEYTPDATGRVRRQGGVGSTHQLGTGHETKYYYGRPDQEELDMIFGNSVGYQYHYQKNMVVDPNGQVSISYLDLSGRVIATALAGESPANVSALPDLPSSTVLTVDAKSNCDLQFSGTEIYSNKVITVPMQSNYIIDYEIAIPRYKDASIESICFDCVYDLEISLIDECGREMLDGDISTAGNQAIKRTIGTITEDFDTECEEDTLFYKFSDDAALGSSSLLVNLPIGSYTLVKRLTINESALSFYENQFLNSNPTLKTEAWYTQQYLSKIDYGQCGSTCDSCQIKLGSKATYLTSHIGKLLAVEIVPTGTDTVYYNAQYDELNEFCKELCNTKIDMCQNMLDIIKADLTPGGQYAKYTIVDNIFTGYGLLDELGTSSNLGFNYYKFWYESLPEDDDNPEIKYLNQDGHIIYVNVDGYYSRINDLTAEEYVKYFQPEWLNSIVDKHPEYCKYRACLDDRASNDYDQNMMQVSTWNEALDSGFLNPIKMTSAPGIGYSAGRKDPFFNTGGRGVSREADMEDSLTIIKRFSFGGTTLDLNIWELVYATYQCDLDNPSLSALGDCVELLNWGQCSAYLDRMWVMYRALYLAEKLKIKDDLMSGCGVLSEAQLDYYEPRFYTYKQMRDSASASTSDIGAISNATNVKIAQQCNSNCHARADDWMQTFEDCDMTDADSALLRSLLIEVCINACDSEHPFGASNVPEGVVVESWKRSFKTVFDSLVSAGKITRIPGVCDINLLNVWSYEHFVDNSSINPTDTNRCDSAWVNAPDCIKEETNPTRKQSMAGGIAIEKPCEKCIDCDVFYQGLSHLQNQYGNVFIDTSNRENVIAANVLNNYFKFNLTWVDYKQFAKRCLGVSDTFSNDSVLYLLSLTYVTFASNNTESYQYKKMPKAPEPIHPFKPNMNGMKYESPIAYASISEPLSVTSLTTDKYLSPCFCNTLKSLWDASTQNINDFNDEMVSLCGGIGVSFDFYSILQKCEEAFNTDEQDPPQAFSSSSSWTDFQKQSLIQLGLEYEIKVPGCNFDCDDTGHPGDDNEWYRQDFDPFFFPPYINEKIPCDSFKRFVRQLKDFDPSLDLESFMKKLSYDHPYFPSSSDTLKLKEIMDYLYGNTSFTSPFDSIDQFPHSRKPNAPRHGFNYYTNFLMMYLYCSSGKGPVDFSTSTPGYPPKPIIRIKPGNGSGPGSGVEILPEPCNCLRKTSYCDTLEALFNSYAATKGSSGNYFAYNGWSLVPNHPEYYETLLYKTSTPSCSTNLKHQISNNKMPFMDFTIQDNCGSTSRIKLSFTQNISNKMKYGRIISFFNFTPVADNPCDTTHYFNVGVILLLQNETTSIQTTLRGYVENYKLIDTCKFLPDTNRLCDRPAIHTLPYKNTCKEQLQTMAKFHAKKAYQEYIDSVRYDFRQKYIAKCMTGFNRETYNVTYPHLQYHYTLYYYDQADNLIQTVPPVGVNVDASSTFLSNVKTARKNNSTGYFPIHTMATRYKYNTLNQLTWQSTPDGGASEFWYDKVGRLVLSRNAKQNATSPKSYSYTNFDALGRILEVGELQSSTTVNTALAFDPSSLATFINAVSKKEVTRTHYDVSVGVFTGLTGYAQSNLRSRVSSIAYYETLPSGANATGTYTQAVHYTYDIHGNVDVLLREMPALAGIGQHFKTTHYDYDLVSGKVNQVVYQKQHADQFAHRYEYDADNRITHAYTSTNLIHWDREAAYEYYLHGPLKRTELGELKVQGIDYAYTLHGWLKGVNSTTLQSDRDIGHDGDPGSINQFVAKDVFGFSLGYYEGDLTAIGLGRSSSPLATDKLFTPTTSGTSLGSASPNLYNGNIRHMVTAIQPFMPDGKPQARAYHYDQLNRIKDAFTYNQLNLSTNVWSSSVSAVPNYEEHFSYDANGNILTLQRNGTTAGGRPLEMDDFTYTYASGTNQLTHVDDAITNTNYNDDIDDQSINNYSYDAIGNMIQDVAEEISAIQWTVYGKIKSITRSGGSQKPNLEYEYSPDGHRVHKKVSYPSGDTINTYYIRDAQGNTMSTYTLKTDTFRWSEAHIYGSSRIGVYNAEKVLAVADTVKTYTINNEFEHIRGKRHYELSNHLGNVLAVVSDRRTGVCTDDELISYQAEIVSVTDYYAFGSPMPGRQGVPKCHIDTIVTIDSSFVNLISEDFSSGTGNFVQISINDNTSISNVTGDELHAEAVWPDNATAYRQVSLVSGMTYTLNFDLVSAASIGSSLMECAILIPGDIQAQAISSGANSFTFTSSYTGFVDIEFSYITDQDEAYSASVPSFDIDNVILTEFVMNEEFESYSVGSFVPNATISPSTTVTNSSGSLLFIGATWPDNPTGYQSVYLENGVTYNVSYDLSYLYYMAGTDTVECRIHLPGSSYVDQQASTGTHNFSFMSNTTGWVDIEFAYLTDQNSMYSSLTPYIEIDKLSIFREILNEDFSSSSTGSFTNNVTGGMPTSSISNPSGVLSVDIAAPFRPATDILVPVTAGHKYSIDFDVVGFSSHSIGFTPIDHSIRCRVEMAGYPTQHFVYTTTSSVPTIIVDVPSGFTGSDIRVEIASILASSALSSNPYIHIDNFVVKHWVGIENTRFDTVCSAWDKGYKYGFNSMEKDNEINVNGGSYDFGARIYDSRLGRWLSLDNSAFNYPSSSPYSSVDNSPILNIDFDGNDFIVSTTKDASGKIILTVSSTIYCVGASPMMIAEMNNIFKQIYKDYESNGIVVKFNVSFVEMKQDLIKTVMKGTESVNKDWNGNNGNNVMYFGVKSDGNKSRVPGTRIKTTNVSFINNSIRLENQIVEAVHEAGHLLGLSDRYDKIIKNDSPNETIPHKGFENDLFGSYGGSKIHDIHYRGYIHSFDKLIKEAMSGNIVNKEYSRTMVEVEEVNKGNGSKGIKFKEEWQPTTLNHTEPKEELDPERFRGKVLVGNTYVNRQRQ